MEDEDAKTPKGFKFMGMDVMSQPGMDSSSIALVGMNGVEAIYPLDSTKYASMTVPMVTPPQKKAGVNHEIVVTVNPGGAAIPQLDFKAIEEKILAAMSDDQKAQIKKGNLAAMYGMGPSKLKDMMFVDYETGPGGWKPIAYDQSSKLNEQLKKLTEADPNGDVFVLDSFAQPLKVVPTPLQFEVGKWYPNQRGKWVRIEKIAAKGNHVVGHTGITYVNRQYEPSLHGTVAQTQKVSPSTVGAGWDDFVFEQSLVYAPLFDDAAYDKASLSDVEAIFTGH